MDTKPTDAGPGYETSDASVRSLVRYGIVLAIITALSFGAMKLLVDLLEAHAERTGEAPPPMMATGLQVPAEPRLQVLPSVDLEKFHAGETASLETYSWVDRQAGVVRIPIERAIEVLAERGLPARAAEARK